MDGAQRRSSIRALTADDFGDLDPWEFVKCIEKLAADMDASLSLAETVRKTLLSMTSIPTCRHPIQALISAMYDLPPLATLLRETSGICLHSPFPLPGSAQAYCEHARYRFVPVREALRSFHETSRFKAKKEKIPSPPKKWLFSIHRKASALSRNIETLSKTVQLLRNIVLE